MQIQLVEVRHKDFLAYRPARYGFAAVSRDPKPFPITNIAAQKPPKERWSRHGHAINAPMPYKQRPQMKTAL